MFLIEYFALTFQQFKDLCNVCVPPIKHQCGDKHKMLSASYVYDDKMINASYINGCMKKMRGDFPGQTFPKLGINI